MTKEELKKCLEMHTDPNRQTCWECPLYYSSCHAPLRFACYEHLKDEESVKDILDHCVVKENCELCPLDDIDDCFSHLYKMCLKLL